MKKRISFSLLAVILLLAIAGPASSAEAKILARRRPILAVEVVATVANPPGAYWKWSPRLNQYVLVHRAWVRPRLHRRTLCVR
jgi:hypothetical protein